MGKLRLLLLISILLAAPRIGLCDIIITKDDMVLNGKIIEDIKNDHVKFATYHGTFTIYYNQIKEKRETDDYREDMQHLKNLGKTVNEDEIRDNYQAGVKKLEEKRKEDNRPVPVSAEFLLTVSPFFMFDAGRIGSLLPYSYGASVTGDVRFRSNYPYLPNSIRIDLQYYHSEKRMKKLSAYRFSLGPVWVFPFKSGSLDINLTIAPLFGTGYYMASSRDEHAANFKWNASLSAGLELIIGSWVIHPQVRFDCVYDKALPLYGIGISIGAGYRFRT